MTEHRPVPPLLLERLAAGELDPEQERQVRARLEQEPEGLARLAALAGDEAQILEAYPPRVVAAAIELRAAKQRQGSARRRLAWAALPAAAAAVVLALVLRPLLTGPTDGVGPTERVKGGPLLVVYRKGEDAVEQLAEGDAVRTGDLLQIGYNAAGAVHGVIISIDGRGRATLHFPRTSQESTRLKQEGEQLLPYAYELDDAPAFERFFFITGQRPLDVGALMKQAESMASAGRDSLSPPSGAAAVGLLLTKSGHPAVTR